MENKTSADPYLLGWTARELGKPAGSCPFHDSQNFYRDEMRLLWLRGWNDRDKERRELDAQQK